VAADTGRAFLATFGEVGAFVPVGFGVVEVGDVSRCGVSAAPRAMMVSAMHTMEEESIPPLSSASTGLSGTEPAAERLP